jgi:hypothetical protein
MRKGKLEEDGRGGGLGEGVTGGWGEKKMNAQHPTSNIERRIGKIKNTGEGEGGSGTRRRPIGRDYAAAKDAEGGMKRGLGD